MYQWYTTVIYFYKDEIQIATHNPINSNLVKIKQKCLHSISNITNVKNKNTSSFVAKTKTDDVINSTHIFLNFLVNLESKSRWKYEPLFHDEPSIAKTYHFLVRVTVALTLDADIDRQGVMKADGFDLYGLHLLTFWGTTLHSQCHTENHLWVSHEKKSRGLKSYLNFQLYIF